MSTTTTTTTTTTTNVSTTMQTQIARKLSTSNIARVRGRSISPRPSILPDSKDYGVPRLVLNTLAENEIEKDRESPIRNSPSPPRVERIVSIGLSTVVSFIDIPLTPYLEWEKKLKEKVFKILGQSFFTKEEIQSTIATVYSNSFKDSNIPLRVEKAVELFSKVEPFPFPFLYDFSQEFNPSAFLQKYQIVQKERKEDVEILEKVIGGKEGLIFLHAAGGQEGGFIKLDLLLEMDKIAPVERRRVNLLRSKFSFKKGFERFSMGIIFFKKSIAPFPIQFLDAEAFSRTFLSFCAEGPFSEKALCLDGKSLTIPNYAELGISPGEDRQNYFLEWMITQLEKERGIQSSLSPKEQRELFQEKKILDVKSGEGKKLKAKIVECLKKTFLKSSEASNPLPLFFDHMSKKPGSFSDFVDQMKLYESELHIYISNHPDFKAKEWEELAVELIGFYCRVHNLKKKQEKIPVLSLLNAMTFDHFSYCTWFFRLVLCPEFHINQPDGYRLILNRTCLSEYNIHPQKEFNVDQLKPFDIVQNQVVKATFWVHWKVKGTQGSFDFEADLQFSNFKFADGCSYEERRIILDQFQLDFSEDETPWKEFLERSLLQ